MSDHTGILKKASQPLSAARCAGYVKANVCVICVITVPEETWGLVHHVTGRSSGDIRLQIQRLIRLQLQ